MIRSFSKHQHHEWLIHASPTTGESIQTFCAKNGWQHKPHSLTGDDCPDATLHEIVLSNVSKDAPVILHFHGGGYRHPSRGRSHVGLGSELGKELGASTLLLLEYTLIPEAQYPMQLRQAALSLRYLITTLDIHPSRIVIGGDSAGGHLAVTLLAHLIQPRVKVPSIPGFQAEGGRLKGMFLLSPWTSMRTDYPSYQQYDATDMIRHASMVEFIEWLKPVPEEIWAEPNAAGPSFWTNAPLDHLFIAAGDIECFRDQIIDLWQKIKESEEGGTACEFVLAEGEVHVNMSVDHALGLPKCESHRRLLAWCTKIANQ